MTFVSFGSFNKNNNNFKRISQISTFEVNNNLQIAQT